MQKIGRVITAVIVAMVLSGLLWYHVGRYRGRTEMVIEAVANNYGHYKILNDLGETRFEWGPAPAGYPVIPKK